MMGDYMSQVRNNYNDLLRTMVSSYYDKDIFKELPVDTYEKAAV